MFTDIVGYTSLMSVDEQRAIALLQRNRDLHKPIIEKHNGDWLKEIGDGTLSAFDSAVDAVNCALEIQKTARDVPDLVLRIGIHVGDVLFEHEDVFGDGVNVASRLEPLAPEGGICISQPVYDAIKNKPEITSQEMGAQALKGIAEPVKTFLVSDSSSGARPITTTGWPATVRRFNWLPVAGVVLTALLVYWLANRFFDDAGSTPRLGNRSIAVLPFTNYSGQEEDEFFSDGITDVILSHLSKISDLKVISRTSIMQYKGTRKSVREIARELGVASILEGSVQRSGGRIRIVSLLIDARTDEHLWAETYDREMADIFAIQSEVAQQIARALKAKLLPEEQQRIEKRPTDNLEAYEWYLRGNDYLYKGSFDVSGRKSELQQAIKVYQQAIELDPGFAVAHARLSYAMTTYYFNHEQLPDLARQAEEAVDHAFALDRNLPEGYLALGYYYNLVDRDYDAALEAFATAQIGMQSNSALVAEIALVQMRQGKWDEALDNFKQAADLDPRSPKANQLLAAIYLYQREYTKAEKVLVYLLTLTPDNPSLYAMKIELALLSAGDIKKAREEVRKSATFVDPAEVLGLGGQLINRLGYWRFGLLDKTAEDLTPAVRQIYPLPRDQLYYFTLAQIYGQDGNAGLSQAYYDSARIWLDNRISANPDGWMLQADYGLACAFLGLENEALAAGNLAKKLMPITECHW